MRIGEAAARSGVSRDTLRYYERKGLLPQPRRAPNGYRDYPAAIVDRVRFVRAGLEFGFSVKQIASFLRSRNAGRPPCREVRRAAEQIAADIDRRIAQLTAARAAMAVTLAAWDEQLGASTTGAPARLLESLVKPSR
jgi:MerR family transcriptional regulator, copper efflux regulator